MEALLERLTEYGVDFVLVGGYAAVAHGATLLTQDLDVCFRFTPENLGKLEAALKDLHPIHRMTPQRLPLDLSAPSTSSLKNLYLNTDWGPLDCLGRITGLRASSV